MSDYKPLSLTSRVGKGRCRKAEQTPGLGGKALALELEDTKPITKSNPCFFGCLHHSGCTSSQIPRLGLTKLLSIPLHMGPRHAPGMNGLMDGWLHDSEFCLKQLASGHLLFSCDTAVVCDINSSQSPHSTLPVTKVTWLPLFFTSVAHRLRTSSLLLPTPCYQLHPPASVRLDRASFFYSWPRCTACGILLPWPGIEPMPPAVEAWSLNHWTTTEFPGQSFLSSDGSWSLWASSLFQIPKWHHGLEVST